MSRSSWLVTKPRADSRVSPRPGEPFVVTIVEPAHFEVPGGANGSDVSTHSLLTTDTTSNREGSVASSPGSRSGQTSSQAFHKNQVSPRLQLHNVSSIPAPQRPPRWSDDDETPVGQPHSATHAFVNKSHRGPEGMASSNPNKDDSESKPSLFEIMEDTECGAGGSLATSRWHHSSRVHGPSKGSSQMDMPARSSSVPRDDRIREGDAFSRLKSNKPHDINVYNGRDTLMGKSARSTSIESDSVRTRGQDSFRFACPRNPYASDSDSPINNSGSMPRNVEIHPLQESVFRGNPPPPIRSIREQEHVADVPLKSSPRSDDVDCLQVDCQSPMSESFYISGDQSRRTAYSNLIFEKAQCQLEAMISSGIPFSQGEQRSSPFANCTEAAPGPSDSSIESVASVNDTGDSSRQSTSKESCTKDTHDQAFWSVPPENDTVQIPEEKPTRAEGYRNPRTTAGTRRPTNRINPFRDVSAPEHAMDNKSRGDLRYPQPGEDHDLKTVEIEHHEVDTRRPPSPLEAARDLVSLTQMSDYDQLMLENKDFRNIVSNLRQLAQDGSIEKVREILGVEACREGNEVSEPRSQDFLINDRLRPSNATGRHRREETMFFDAQEDIRSGDSDLSRSGHGTRQDIHNGTSGYNGNEGIYSESIFRSPTDDMADVAQGLQLMLHGGSSSQAKLMRLDESSRATSVDQMPTMQETADSVNPSISLNRRSSSARSRNSGSRSDSAKSRSAINKFFSKIARKKQSKGSGASFGSHLDSDGQTDSLPSSRVNGLDGDVSFYKSAEQSREPDGSGSIALPPHPLHEIASARLVKKIYEGDETEDSWGGQSLDNGFEKTRISAEVGDKHCVLKVRFRMQDSQSSDNRRSDSYRRQEKPLFKKHPDYSRARQGPSQPEPEPGSGRAPMHELMSSRTEVYRPTNDVDQILQTTKKDCKTWKGPLSDEEILFYMEFNGKWKADKSTSDSYDSLCKVMELGWFFRKGLDASDIILFDHSVEECKSIAKIVKLIDLVERRPWVGTVVEHNRRDNKSGKSYCWVERYDGGFVMRVNWGDPCAGTLYEFVELTADGQKLVLRQDLYRNEGGLSSHIRIVFDRVQ